MSKELIRVILQILFYELLIRHPHAGFLLLCVIPVIHGSTSNAVLLILPDQRMIINANRDFSQNKKIKNPNQEVNDSISFHFDA